MDDYIALYRKYRSQTFGELMGQGAVTTTLQNAIRSHQIAHAYLFYGARGCGKTSTARLVARALNCVAQDGPTPEPCGRCRLCTAIRDGVCMDVVEIDAASETGVDNVREKIIENVQYVPTEARYKVYIIDEVHDLSSKAFDALLKTLEEPPAHVVFILATTEQHKVPITIRSRCMQFQFKRGTVQDLSSAIQRVITQEGYTADPEAVQSIARSAEGSWRDALSLLEQVIAYSEHHITAEAVQSALGTVGQEMLTRVVETLARGCWDETLEIAGELIDSGKDARQILTALNGHLRDLLLVLKSPRYAMREMGAERLALLAPQAALFTPEQLLQMQNLLSAAEKETRFTNQHRWLLERTLCTLMSINLTQFAGSAEVLPPPARRFDPDRQQTRSQPKTDQRSIIPVPPTPRVVEDYVANLPDASEASEQEEEESVAEISGSAPSESVSSLETASPRSTQLPEVKREHREVDRFAEGITLTVLQRAWPRIMKSIEKDSPPAFTYLQKADVVGLEGNIVVLRFKESLPRDRIQNKGREWVEKRINQVLETTGYKIRCILESEDGGSGGIGAPSKPTSSPSAPSNGAAPPEPLVLLDAPPGAPVGPTRIADFETVAPPPDPTDTSATKLSASPTHSPSGREDSAGAQASNRPASTGMLAETLDIFGGEVISTEPL